MNLGEDSFYFNNCTFEQNKSGMQGSAIKSVSIVQQATNYIYNSTFRGNQAESSATIELMSNTIVISNISLLNNYAQVKTEGIAAISSVLVIHDALFSNR